MKIAIMGVGGLGGYFGGCLARGGEDVTFIARGANLAAMRENGLQVHSPQGDFHVESVQATDSPAQAGIMDLILFTVKSYDVEDALQQMAPMVGPETAVLPLQNGIGHIAQMQAALGDGTVLGGMTLISSHKGEPGVIHHVLSAGQYELEFGELSGDISTRCERIHEVFADAGMETALTPNIAERMWWKLAAFSGVIVLAVVRGPKSIAWIDETRELTRSAIAESVAVANAQGTPLADSVPEDVLGAIDQLSADYKPSLLVDLENGRRLEVEAISGYVGRSGRETGVPTPANDFVYACLKPHINGTP